ncbi:hypothetical protein [Persicobacter diffluens]|uniref:Carboxypeptidase regulatory-like domain-containing protein n=1 Tax=Persicobacter diffluens TaxID=981 RepID=A0AAN5AKD5_9BACT|nr:hypothetical protein PEDI_22890 [Persicobacter diffluens]
MSKNQWVFLLASLFWVIGCKSPAQESMGTIEGNIYWKEGNHMPMIGAEPKAPQGVERTLYFFEPVKSSEIERNALGLFNLTEAKAVATIKSDKNGHFKGSLPAGQFSVLVKEEEGFFGNIMNGEGVINPVSIEAGGSQKMDIQVDYKATY